MTVALQRGGLRDVAPSVSHPMASRHERPIPRGPEILVPGFVVRRARLSDVRRIVRIYRGMSAEDRAVYHPFPFDRVRLGWIMTTLVVSQRLGLWGIRHFPRLSAVVLVVSPDDGGRSIAYATVRFVVEDGEVRSRFGYVIQPEFRAKGMGTQLLLRMCEASVAVHVPRFSVSVLKENSANVAILRKFGFETVPGEDDRHAPNSQNLVSRMEVRTVIERFHEYERRRTRATGSNGGVPSVEASPAP